VTKSGLRAFRQSGITLRIADRVSLGVKLEVDSPEAQAVEVRADAPLLDSAGTAVTS